MKIGFTDRKTTADNGTNLTGQETALAPAIACMFLESMICKQTFNKTNGILQRCD